ncbi:hypothetical protein LINPERPRIM_LOCUS1443 [Linum perenne]
MCGLHFEIRRFRYPQVASELQACFPHGMYRPVAQVTL